MTLTCSLQASARLGANAVAILCTAATAACDDAARGFACTAEVRPGIVLEILDSVTNLPAAFGAVVVAKEAGYEDTLRMRGSIDSANAFVAGAFERAGTYALTVNQAGYVPWSQGSVQVTRGPCHVNPVQMTAHLLPSP